MKKRGLLAVPDRAHGAMFLGRGTSAEKKNRRGEDPGAAAFFPAKPHI